MVSATSKGIVKYNETIWNGWKYQYDNMAAVSTCLSQDYVMIWESCCFFHIRTEEDTYCEPMEGTRTFSALGEKTYGFCVILKIGWVVGWLKDVEWLDGWLINRWIEWVLIIFFLSILLLIFVDHTLDHTLFWFLNHVSACRVEIRTMMNLFGKIQGLISGFPMTNSPFS